MNRSTCREFFRATAAATVTSALLQPVHVLAESVKPVCIKNIDIFSIEIPTPREHIEAGYMNRYTVAKVGTDTGVRGYSFAGPDPGLLDRAIRPALIGKDLFALEEHLKAGLIEWGGLEHALWDAIGKIAGLPVHRLLGGSKSGLRVYLTCVWEGPDDQSQVRVSDQVQMAIKIKKAGFKGMKIRAWQPEDMANVDACQQIIKAVGPDFRLMFDRTANYSGKLWDYNSALKVAQGLEEYRAYWLEEPFDRNDFLSPARLAREMDILITGGEGFRGLDPYRECLVNETYDILQPDAVNAGGILTIMKIAALAEAFHKPVILHGSMGLRLAGWLQASAAIDAPWQELGLITPPLLPDEQWCPALKVLNSNVVFALLNGEIQLPQAPGLGLDVNEEALYSYRVT